MEIEHIINGEEMERVREKLNIIIDAFNATFPVSKSYDDLINKPAIDGIELNSETRMLQFDIPITSLPDSIDLKILFINEARLFAETIARTVAQEEVNPTCRFFPIK